MFDVFTFRVINSSHNKHLLSNNQMKTKPKHKQTKRLDPRKVRIALATEGLTQTELAHDIERNYTSVNLAINHGRYPQTIELIRKRLKL